MKRMSKTSSSSAPSSNGHHKNGSAVGNGTSNSSSSSSTTANGQTWKLTKILNESEQDQEALINRKLPKELLLRVFSHLDVIALCRCAQVNYWLICHNGALYICVLILHRCPELGTS